jgi:hypothetical protein
MVIRLVSTVVVFSLPYYLLFSYYDHTRLPVTMMTMLTSLFLSIWLFHFRRESMIVMLRKQIIYILLYGYIVWFVFGKVKMFLPVVSVLIQINITLFFLACQETSRQIMKWFKSR